MDDFRDLSSLRDLLDLARSQVQPEDLPAHVMGDPGTPDYIAAYTLVLRGGVHSLDDEYDGGRLADSFDIGENLLLFHNDAPRSVKSRWLSIIASGIELYVWDGFEGPRGVAGGAIVGHLLEDGLALVQAESDDRPWRIYPHLFRSMRTSENHHLRLAVCLAELMTATGDLEATADLCRDAEELLASFHDRYREVEGEWVPNGWYARDPVWGPLASSRKDRRRWKALLEACLPTSPSEARLLRERLLTEPPPPSM